MTPDTSSETHSQRASIFDDDLDLDLSAFAPRRPENVKPDKEALRTVAESRGFSSREPVSAPPAAPEPQLQRRYRTGRNRQLNLKVTDEALRRFYALADAQGLVLGEVFEQAVSALEDALKAADKTGRP
ncbi:stability/partitioning determinant [Asticcacaulis sp. EMRT-3]|uniref:stability/partitioning determinant n=1 Tax=Asticcacaulis sp. EMRT-3 TaxID=3040349 RepID=UPI0024AFFBC6|nr:stability/partitioning determinant [Asticcacaulis sp. EMRT-3]MDI7776648.1 stability/partitioning determinant [Asticcacaulis sp. EMRT-3]